MSSVRELETRNAIERKKLMQAVFRYLGQSGVKARLMQEPALDSLGVPTTESAIQLNEQRISSIRLIRMNNVSCSDGGDVLRFQYKLQLQKELPVEFLQKLRARTKTIKAGKVLGLFGGKMVGVKWIGQELADILNRDAEVSKTLLRCMEIWGEMELKIDPICLSEIHISGPWFINPGTIIALYSPGKSYEEQNCVFGYKTADRLAKLIQEMCLRVPCQYYS